MPPLLRSILSSIAVLGGCVLGHGGLNNYTVGDQWYTGYDPSQPAAVQDGQPWMVQRKWISIDPIFEADDEFIACNYPGTRAVSYIDVQAGQNISAWYYYWLHPTGPMSVWLAECGDTCDYVDVNSLNWFKIWHAGLVDDGAYGLAESTWYQKAFQRWDGQPSEWPITIPSTIKSGLYLIRHEIMSIHVANKPQFYPECANLNITGSGTALPPESFYKTFPGVYTMDDPAVNIDIYSEESTAATSYDPPGGPVWEG